MPRFMPQRMPGATACVRRTEQWPDDTDDWPCNAPYDPAYGTPLICRRRIKANQVTTSNTAAMNGRDP